MRNFLRFDETIFGICYVVLSFFSCCIQFLRMYCCNFNYNCVRFYSLNCALIIVLACLVVLIIDWTRFIDHRNLAQMTRYAQHRQPRPLKNGWIRYISKKNHNGQLSKSNTYKEDTSKQQQANNTGHARLFKYHLLQLLCCLQIQSIF